MNYIELFAGCGGLSLGLESVGFDLLTANELSPMASETFAYNHLGLDLARGEGAGKVFWISSNFNKTDTKSRLRENPLLASGMGNNKHSDLKGFKVLDKDLRRSLLIGSISDLNLLLESKQNGLLKSFKGGFGSGGVDLVSGGPPCQSFSMAGLRNVNNNRNKLPWEFSRFVGMVKPKIALLENVSGILRAFKIGSKNYYAWFEVAKAFAAVGYVPLCLHVNAKYSGVAQNRPRFIMISLREDFYKEVSANLDDESFLKMLEPSYAFYKKLKKGYEAEFGCLPYYDVEKDEEFSSSTLLKGLAKCSDDFVSVGEAIDDLRSKKLPNSEYVESINNLFSNRYALTENKLLNHELRRNSEKTRARFRLYQVMNKVSLESKKFITTFLKSEAKSELPNSVILELRKHWLLDDSGKRLIKPTGGEIRNLLSKLITKKQTQRALRRDEPAPAALSIPDDACHYSEDMDSLRTLTVREMARIQSFPDWYEFKSKITTGGQMRKFEVPQYTQIGNAVPPLLGLALGELCKELLSISRKS